MMGTAGVSTILDLILIAVLVLIAAFVFFYSRPRGRK